MEWKGEKNMTITWLRYTGTHNTRNIKDTERELKKRDFKKKKKRKFNPLSRVFLINH